MPDNDQITAAPPTYKADDGGPTHAKNKPYKNLGAAHRAIKDEMGAETLKAVISKEAAYEQTHGTGPEVKAKELAEINREIDQFHDAKQKGSSPKVKADVPKASFAAPNA